MAVKKQAIIHTYKEHSTLVKTDQRIRDSTDAEMETQQVRSTRCILKEKEKEGSDGSTTCDAVIISGMYYITGRFTLDT